MPLLLKKRPKKPLEGYGVPEAQPNPSIRGSTLDDNQPSLADASLSATSHPAVQASSRRALKYAPHLSKSHVDVAGLPVVVYGVEQLSPAPSRASAPRPPDVTVVVHLHGRTGKADDDEPTCRQLWHTVQQCTQRDVQAARRPEGGPTSAQRELLVVAFDARNHGHRTTREIGQKGWKQGNELHAQDCYGMIVGGAADVSFLLDFLPSYLFPHDERSIAEWVVTGKSLGGHTVWHVLTGEPRIRVGVPLIGCPSYARLMAGRAQRNLVRLSAPHFPAALRDVVARTDPARLDPLDEGVGGAQAQAQGEAANRGGPSEPVAPHFDDEVWSQWRVRPSSRVGADGGRRGLHPLAGKKVCVVSGRDDRLVPWHASEPFVSRLLEACDRGGRADAVGAAAESTGRGWTPGDVVVHLEDGVGHEVNEEMVRKAGEWIYRWAIRGDE